MSYLAGTYITQEGLENIRHHKYKAGEYSRCDKLMNPFWEFVVTLFPTWFSPNLMTVLGFVFEIGCYSVMLYHDMSMTQPLPRFTFFLSAFGIFMFQTLDAIDGKQARRTGSSTPLGQFFDHGLDALTWTITNMTLISFLGYGLCFNSILCIFASNAPFFLTNLLEYYSGVYEYNIGNVDATAGLFILIGLNIFPFFAGNQIYNTPVKEAIPLLSGIIPDGLLFAHFVMFIVVYVGIIYSIMCLYHNYKAVSGFKNYITLSLRIVLLMAVFVILYSFDNSIPFIHDNAGLVFLTVGLLFAIVSTKLIVCLMSKMYFNFVHLEYLIVLVYFYFQYNYEPTPEHDFKLKCAFYFTFFTYLVLYIRLFQVCVSQITEHLGISCFKIGEQKIKKS